MRMSLMGLDAGAEPGASKGDRGMRIYIASSWRNQHAVEMLSDLLEARGHEVISFVRKAVNAEGRTDIKFDFDQWIVSEDGAEKFHYDLDGATNSDLVIYIGPSGQDAWAEIGAAWTKRQLRGYPMIVGLWAKGENVGLMRRMMDWFMDYRELLAFIDRLNAGG